jgi:hypothetical protein
MAETLTFSEPFTLVIFQSITASAATKTYQFAQDVTAETATKTKQVAQDVLSDGNKVTTWTSNVANNARQNIGIVAGFYKDQAVSTAKDAKERVVDFLAIPAGQAAVSYPSNKTAKVDMKLGWFNVVEGNYGEAAADLFTGVTFANIRWEKATAAAAPGIAAIVDERKSSFIEVSGINTKGIPAAEMEKLPKLIGLKPGETMVVCDSAGTDACAQSMSLTTRDKSDVFYLLLSPRMPPARLATYMQAGGVSPDHVITINSNRDIPHWSDKIALPDDFLAKAVASGNPTQTIGGAVVAMALTWPHFWHDYEAHPETGTHVYMMKGHKLEGSDSSGLSHVGMYEGLTNGRKYDVVVNGKTFVQNISLPNLINEIERRKHE